MLEVLKYFKYRLTDHTYFLTVETKWENKPYEYFRRVEPRVSACCSAQLQRVGILTIGLKRKKSE